MIIREIFYDEDYRNLYVEFSTKEDGDDYYRKLELTNEDILYYSPEVIEEEDLNSLTEDIVIELIKQYLLENELPEREYL